jgi:hypothetical protein
MNKVMVLIIALAMSIIFLPQPVIGSCDDEDVTIWGTEGSDIIEGTEGPDVIKGLGGHDVIDGKGGDDIICGNSGNDTIYGGEGDDILVGNGNHDVLEGNQGEDILYGGNGNDTLRGGYGIDELYGGGGNDTCYGWSKELFESCEVPNLAAVPRTGQTKRYAPGDDRNWRMGVRWPEPRFTNNRDGTVTDFLTGLIWLKNADCVGGLNWFSALSASNDLADGQCGLSDGSVPGDWRLPNVRELLSLVDYGEKNPALPSGHPFTGVRPLYYWASTTYANSPDNGWVVHMNVGVVNRLGKGIGPYVWPVRGGN